MLAQLKQQTHTLVADNALLSARCKQYAEAYDYLKEQMLELRRQMFGKRSERYIEDPESKQLSLLSDISAEFAAADAKPLETQSTVLAYTRTTKKSKSSEKDLPRRIEIIPLSDKDKFCSCGLCKTVIRYESKDLVNYVPEIFEIVEQRREVAACPKGCDSSIITAPAPLQILPKVKATESFLAFLVVSKLEDRQGNVFEGSTDATLVNCNAHARRKFEPIAKSNKGKGIAKEAMCYFKGLYKIEREGKDKQMTPEQRYQLRQEKAKPLLEEFNAWIDKIYPTVLPVSTLGNAVNYCIKYRKGLMRYLEDGRLEIDNNLTEQQIKPLVIARKNFLFCDSVKGAQALCIHFGLIRTAKQHGLDPYNYYIALLKAIPHCKTVEDYEKLLPWNIRSYTAPIITTSDDNENSGQCVLL